MWKDGNESGLVETSPLCNPDPWVLRVKEKKKEKQKDLRHELEWRLEAKEPIFSLQASACTFSCGAISVPIFAQQVLTIQALPCESW